MNRREFVRTLAGLPLLGLLVKVPKAEEGLHLIMPGDPGYVDVSVGQGELNILESGDPRYVDWARYVDWESDWTRDIVNAEAQRIDDEILSS